MIVYPKGWKKIGVKIQATDIEQRLVEVLKEINCDCLSLSGGIDSSLLLYYMCQLFGRVKVFTMGISESHPDVIFAKSIVEHYGKKFDSRLWHYIYYPRNEETKDAIYELFYRFVSKRTKKIIAGDTVDEYMCGYYAHMKQPTEEVYYDYIRQLQKEHLVPLNKASGKVEVCLPYADDKIIGMFSQIPLRDKVDSETRKKVMIEMAKGKVPEDVILRRKYGFCDAFTIKGVEK